MKSQPKPWMWGALLSAASMVVWWRPLRTTLQLALQREEYTHILLILPVSAALMWRESPAWRNFAVPNPKAGGVLLTLAVLIGLPGWIGWAGAPNDVRLAWAMLALVVFWIGAFVLCCGGGAARLLIFPLGFLLWLVPIPASVLASLISWLQQGSSAAADILFSAASVPVIREGINLSIPGLNIEVATECSSIRSSLMLVVTTMVLAQVLLRSAWRKALVIALSIPLSVAKNGLRIFAIAMLGTRVDSTFLTGRFHHRGGVIFFSIALVAVLLVLWVLRKGEHQAPVPLSAMNPVNS